ncbi:SPO22-domain-containing protein [Xylariaceae sp. FL1651]|nr:SPO22-domain-containing protein [Xylariaceae sp. FL1651]
MEVPTKPTNTRRGQQLIDSVIQFSNDFRVQFVNKADESSLRDLNHEVENQIHTLRNHSCRTTDSQHRGQLGTAGLSLWNWCTRMKRDGCNQLLPTRDNLFVLVRVLSFLMLALAQSNDESSPKSIIHLERLAIKTGRTCIANNAFDFALLTLQKAAEYNRLLQQLQGTLPEEDMHACSQFEAEYTTLRIAWKEDRMDVAEHLYAGTEKIRQTLDPSLAEKLADALFEIGRNLADKKNSVLAAKWLERAYELINGQEIDRLSRDAIELRLAISQAMIQVYLDTQTPESFERAKNHIAYIESELGDKLIVLLFRIELLLRSPAEVFDSNAYADILGRMMRTVDMSESSFKLLLYHIRKLDDKNHSAACSALDEFLKAYVLTAQRDEWVDKTTILRTHMAVREDSHESIKALEAVLDQAMLRTGKPLLVNTAASIQTLIWKKADADFNQEQFDRAAEWCQLALHPALGLSGPSNTGKMSRKLLLCAIHINDLATAGEVLRTMNEITLREPMTAYLAFKVALKQGNGDSALQCLTQISEASPPDPRYLYACCLEAQQAHDRLSTIEALRHIALKHQLHSSSVHLPALLRLLIRLEVSELNEKHKVSTDQHLLVDDVCKAFKIAVNEIQKERRNIKSDKLFTVDELDWFCKNSYNLGLKNTTVWEARHIICILECCLTIISSYPPDIPAQAAADISLRGMFCDFMVATVLLATARSEDNVEIQLQDYLNMRRHVKHFNVTLESRHDTLDDVSRVDLYSKLSTLLVFEFEGAICLKSWDDLKSIILKAQSGHNLSAYQAMADCILRCQFAPAQGKVNPAGVNPYPVVMASITVLYSTLRELVNQIWTLEHFDSKKLAKYMRCLLKATLPMGHKISLNLVEEVCTMVKRLASNENHFPSLDLEWITATTFNHGVDLYGSHEDELSKIWIAHALTLAHYLQDGGEMEKVLQDKYILLKWDDGQIDADK